VAFPGRRADRLRARSRTVGPTDEHVLPDPGVDRQAVETYYAATPEETRLFQSIVKRPGRREGSRSSATVCTSSFEPDGETWRVNTSRIIGRDGTNAEDLTAAEIEDGDRWAELMSFFRRGCPGFERCTLVEVGPAGRCPGKPPDRRRVRLTAEDPCLRTRLPRHHCLLRLSHRHPRPGRLAERGGPSFSSANAYQIPFRCLVPREVEQLLVAGRSLSATHEAAASVRVMPPCFAMGQAAGTAAALALKAGVPVRCAEIAGLRRLPAPARRVSGGRGIGGGDGGDRATRTLVRI